MLKDFKLPELAEGVTSAVVVAVLTKSGDRVDADQIVAELENDKATAELPVPFAGVVQKVHKREGDEISVGELLLTIEVDHADEEEPHNDIDAPADGKPERDTQKRKERSDTGESSPAEAPIATESPGKKAHAEPSPMGSADADSFAAVLPAGPEVRRLARELGVDLQSVEGTGPRGRITSEDVRSHTRQMLQERGGGERVVRSSNSRPGDPDLPDFAQWGDIDVRPMSGVRRKTADVVSLSWRLIPNVVQHDRADLTSLNDIRKAWQAREGVKTTVTAMVLKAVAAALKLFPRFNCSVDMANHKLVYKKYIHLAVAVDAGHGLLTPVIRNADRMSVAAIAEALSVLSTKAREKQLSLDEMAGSTFAVSNLGGLGTTAFGPIVTWPHVAALGVGKAEVRPEWNGETFEPRHVLPLSLSYDHRANDGADAARFLRWIAEAIADPMKILMEAG